MNAARRAVIVSTGSRRMASMARAESQPWLEDLRGFIEVKPTNRTAPTYSAGSRQKELKLGVHGTVFRRTDMSLLPTSDSPRKANFFMLYGTSPTLKRQWLNLVRMHRRLVPWEVPKAPCRDGRARRYGSRSVFGMFRRSLSRLGPDPAKTGDHEHSQRGMHSTSETPE